MVRPSLAIDHHAVAEELENPNRLTHLPDCNRGTGKAIEESTRVWSRRADPSALKDRSWTASLPEPLETEGTVSSA